MGPIQTKVGPCSLIIRFLNTYNISSPQARLLFPLECESSLAGLGQLNRVKDRWELQVEAQAWDSTHSIVAYLDHLERLLASIKPRQPSQPPQPTSQPPKPSL